MKPVFAIITALAALAYAAPAPEAEAGPAAAESLEKRQTFGCDTSCSGGQKSCWSCNSGGCSYTKVPC